MFQHKFVKTSLIVFPVLVFLALFIWNIKDYMGIYEDIIQLVLLATAAIFVPSLLEGKNALSAKWVVLISVGTCVICAVLFWFTKPAYTTQQAAQTLMDTGYTSIAIGEDEHTRRIEDGANFFVNDGYLYICRIDNETSEKVLFNPQTGAWSVVE